MEHRPENFPALEDVSGGEIRERRPPPVRKVGKKSGRSFRRVHRRQPASLARKSVRLLFLVAFLFLAGDPLWKFVNSDPAWAFEPDAQAVLLGRHDELLVTWPEYGDRRPVDPAGLPRDMVHAALAREDKRFFKHPGLDPIGLGRAASIDLKERRIVQGGSTITMQLVERVYHYPQNSDLQRIRAKVFEMLMAPRIEFYSLRKHGDFKDAKNAVLAAYLSRVEFGHRTVGLREAAHLYFKKKPAQLTLGECAYLAGLIRGPSVNNAYRSPENARLARDAVIANMEKLDFVSSARADQVSFYVNSEPGRKSRHGDGFTSAAVRRELDHLAAAGEIPTDYLGSGRLLVHLAVDPAIQDLAEKTLFKQLHFIESQPGFRGERGNLQGAVVAIDNKTGAILASVGGRDFDRLSYDCAQQARRTVASAVKPFVYASLMETTGISTEDAISNAGLTEVEAAGFAGPRFPRETKALSERRHPLWKGLAFSSNRMTLRVGVLGNFSAWTRLLARTGLVEQAPARYTGSWLGSFEVKPVDLAAAYAVFPRSGHYTSPYFVRRVELDGSTIYRARPESQSVLSTGTCNEITKSLREVLRVGTTSTYGGKEFAQKFPVAGKTGTSDGSGDAWFVGYNSDVTVAVWIGFPDGSRTILDGGTGGNLAFPVWNKIMERLPGDYEFGPLPELGADKSLALQ